MFPVVAPFNRSVPPPRSLVLHRLGYIIGHTDISNYRLEIAIVTTQNTTYTTAHGTGPLMRREPNLSCGGRSEPVPSGPDPVGTKTIGSARVGRHISLISIDRTGHAAGASFPGLAFSPAGPVRPSRRCRLAPLAWDGDLSKHDPRPLGSLPAE